MRCALALLFACALLTAGCASTSSITSTVYVASGKFDALTCEELAKQAKDLSKRIQDLSELMEKSQQDAGGAVVNVVAYWPTFASTRAEREQVEEAQQRNNCSTEPPQAAPEANNSKTVGKNANR